VRLNIGANRALFDTINQKAPDGLGWLAQLGAWLGDYWGGSPLLAGMLLAAWLLSCRGAKARATWLRHLALYFAIGYGLAFLGVTLLKFGFDYPRPVIALGEHVRVIGTSELRYSFPSGHAAYAALLAATAWPMLGRAGRAFALAFVLWISWSRIAAGAHFPADVVGGAFVGAISALAARWLVRRQQHSVKLSVMAQQSVVVNSNHLH